MATRRLTWLDVFTSRPLAGNGLAVVHDADGLDDTAMLGFARETKLSETTFVQTATEDGADYRNRIWMTTRELPFAGHPSLGTAVAVAHARGERQARYVQQTGAGLQPVEVEFTEAGTARAAMLQEPARFGPEPDPAVVLAALGLVDADGHPELPPQFVSCGVEHLLVPVRDETVLARLHPDPDALAAVFAQSDAVCAYVCWPEPDGVSVQARAFFLEGAPIVGGGQVAEDPATGSAAGPLTAYLHERAGAERIEIVQGIAMGRPSRLVGEAGERVRVAGDVVVLIEGVISL
jgi:trans-2,3-dihydro-3-hydroxyanthranilate isomerase